MSSIEQIVARDALRIAQSLSLSQPEARGEAQILLARSLARSRAWLMAHAADPITHDALASTAYNDWLQRRLTGEPVAYILGEREFYGMTFEVNRHVLIPRPETELLVDAALNLLPSANLSKVLDLGTGSGCIALAIATHAKRSLVLATDNCHNALAVAACNTQRHHSENLDLLHSDWYESVAPWRFDVIVSNPPYVAADDQHLQQGDLRFEPTVALTPGRQALASIAHIVHKAPEFLREGGWLLLEHGHDQGAEVRALLERRGFQDIATLQDLAAIPRVSMGRSI